MQVSFKLQRRVVNWDSFDHFKMGELVCLNDEKSDKWIFAVVMFTDLSVIRRGISPLSPSFLSLSLFFILYLELLQLSNGLYLGSLIIKFIREADLVEFDWEQEYTMVESTNFFGAVRPVLERLQVLRSDHILINFWLYLLYSSFILIVFFYCYPHIPFLPVLLKGAFSVGAPPYLEMEPMVDLSPVSFNPSPCLSSPTFLFN